MQEADHVDDFTRIVVAASCLGEIWDSLGDQRLLVHRHVGSNAEQHRDAAVVDSARSEEHTSELQSRGHLVCRLLLEKKNMTAGCTGYAMRYPARPSDLLPAHRQRFPPK